MKRVSLAKLILPGLIIFFTACKKETGELEISTQTEQKANTVAVKNNQVTVTLIGIAGFADPCFNLSVDSVFQESFRFTGGSIFWNYKNLTLGLHSFSFSCLHECKIESGSEILRFEIDDNETRQQVSSRETDHCKHEFWLIVN
jgi:hypothetical protein